MSTDYAVACYYFPNYHVDPRNEAVHGEGWTEWELVKRAEPRFEGHRQPLKPLWGYEDESDPVAMAKKIDAAADHGIDTFIFDWYWYDDGPYLERGLDKGFLNAANNDRMKFGLMWANHDWKNIHPAKLKTTPEVLYPGVVTRETFDTVVTHCIENYFKHPSYWLINGCPYFSIYELTELLGSFGGVAGTREALDSFRARTKEAGFPDLHLNVVMWSIRVLPGETAVKNPKEMVEALGVDSIGSYVWVHHVKLDQFPETPYRQVLGQAQEHWHQAAETYEQPFHPNVTMGWDSSPRTVQSDRYLPVGYPFGPTLSGNTPEAFEEALKAAKRFLDGRPEKQKVVGLNAWNEWTEGSYLEPDTVNGMAYLEAVKRVFG